MKKLMLVSVLCLTFAAVADGQWKRGEGVANGAGANVDFVPRGAGQDYGYGSGRQYFSPLGLTLLSWSLPNEMSVIGGLRVNFGWGRYERTYGVDLGAFSKSGTFGGIAANLGGNFCTGKAEGLQMGAVNLVDGEMSGIQVGFVNGTARLRGLQIGLLNFNEAGITLPIINCGF